MSVLNQKTITLFISFIVFFSCSKEQNPADKQLQQKICSQKEHSKSNDNLTYQSVLALEDLKQQHFTLNKLHALQPTSFKLLLEKEETLASDTNMTEKDYSINGVFSFDNKNSVDLGMSNVPVLDQGTYGTCVTFATTAAMNVILGFGDYISQQCTLMLTDALGQNYWEGAYRASQILAPLQQYGIVSKANCPFEYPNIDATFNVIQYQELTDVAKNLQNIVYKYYAPITLDQVKNAINSGHRIIFGFGIISKYGSSAIGGFDAKVDCDTKLGGLWACSQPGSSINYCGMPTGGHEAIIIGYDDSQEILKIRNSWGSEVGDQGNFYMTYKFFNSMGIDGTEIY